MGIMRRIKTGLVRFITLFITCASINSHAEIGRDGLGQTIQISTRLRSYIGQPSWLLVIRDIDNNQTMPYLFDIKRGNQFWLVFTYGRNYLITASTMQINTYRSRRNDFNTYKINNFCHLESNGRIVRGESLYITITGDLTSDGSGISCQISRFVDPNFTVAPSTHSE